MIGKFFGRLLAFIGFLTVLLITFIIIVFVYNFKTTESIPEKAVLTLNLNNLTITESPTRRDWRSLITGASTSLYDVTNAIDQAAKDPRIKGLSMRADIMSLGHSQVQELRDVILRFRKRGKFAAFYTDSFGELTPATLTYYLATAFDQVWIQPAGFLNITGLFAALPFAAKALENIGIKVHIGSREEYKTAMSFLTDKEMSPENSEQTKNLLKGLFSEIVKGITIEREITEEAVLKAMEESPLMTAEKALKLGFIDVVGYFDVFEHDLLSRIGEGTKLYPLSKYIETLQAEEKYQLHDNDEIALIYGAGMIQSGKEHKGLLEESFLTSTAMHKAFEAAIKDPKVKGIVFRINSPGGSAVASESILRWVKIAQNHKVPVIASMGDVAASGGYWIATPCNKIVAQPMTITGSIGVLAGKVVLGGLLEKLDINLGIVSEGPNGSFWSYTQDYTDPQWALLQGVLDEIYNQFIQRVVEGRKLSIDHVKQIAKGQVWLGNQAKQFGLIDELGGLDKAIEIAKKEARIPAEQEVRIVVYPKPQSLLEQLKSFYEEDTKDSTNMVQAIYQTLNAVALFLKIQSQPFPVLAPLPDKVE